MSDTMPAWEVTIYGLAISMPTVAAKVGWLESPSHPKRKFRTRRAAEKYVAHCEGKAAWSLIPIRWRGEIVETTRSRDWRDNLASIFSVTSWNAP